MGDVTLWCLVIDDALEPVGGAFDLNAPPDDRFGDLADKIIVKATIESKPKATGLTLWKLSDEWKLTLYPLESLKSNLKQLHLDRESGKETNNKAFWLSPIQKISKVFNKELEEDDCAHILVQLPVQTIRSRGANKRLRDEASDVLNRLRAKKTRVQLPPLRDLLSILDRPFDETEKIAVSHDSYDDLITPKFYNNDICEEADVALLFKRSEIDAISPLILSLYATVVQSPSATGTEESFHRFWDKNIRDVIELILDQGYSIRNSNKHAETKKMRPDFGFLVQNVCVFRGEEKGPENPEDPRAELADKLMWVYNPAEYMLGYYCRGLELTLVAICPPSEGRGKPIILDLASANLRIRRDRIINIRRLINLTTLLKPLSDIVQSASGEFQPMKRNFSTVEITASCIVKTYTCSDADARIKHLDAIYASLQEWGVPNTDRIIYAKGEAVYLAPRGILVPPKTQVDLRECVICILDALVVLHEIPIFHRDIRWTNIIQSAENPRKWILIDWEDAAIP